MSPKKGAVKHCLSQIDAENQRAVCSVCGPVKIYPRTENGGKYKHWRCSTKGKEKANKSYRNNPCKDIDERRRKARVRHLWTMFRLTPEELETIIQFQKNHEIYRLLLGQNDGTDHCHKTGLIRGRLDWRINRAYGLLEKVAPKNLPEVLRALAYFHENPPAELALGEKRYGLMGKAQHKKKMVYGPPK